MLRLSRSAVLLWWIIITLLAVNSFPVQQEVAPALFTLIAILAHGALFCLPTWAAIALVTALNRHRAIVLWQTLLVHGIALATVGLLLANYKLHTMYGFYINNFVLNILLTPGGIDALGLNDSFYRTLLLLSSVVIALYWLAIRFVPLEGLRPSLSSAKLSALLLTLFVGQALMFSFAEYSGKLTILQSSQNIAWYVPVTAKSFYRKLGFTAHNKSADWLPTKTAANNANAKAIEQLVIDRRYNVVWLVAESLRADMLDNRVMPATFAFGENNSRFMSHYSGGNGTRMGMFTQFYGIYGNHWFDALESMTPPPLLDTLMNNGYAMKAFSSATFTYPEFNRTIFSDFKPSQLQSYPKGKGWQRDRKNVDDLLVFMDQASDPFFAFMFFESSHANYYFPPESVIEADYIKDFDYLATNITDNIAQIKSRYVNATHHLDSQIGRVLDHLKKTKQLDNTIVIVTGDHGEEFMEKGRWGHNATFSQEQIRVPLIVHVPGGDDQKITAMTSHIDLPATVYAALGITEDTVNVGNGKNLLASNYQRDFAVVSDWHGNAMVTDSYKYIMSSKAVVGGNRITTLDDQPVSAADMPANNALLARFFSELSLPYSMRSATGIASR